METTAYYNRAVEVASQSPCKKRHVGAVIINNETNQIVATGYNTPGHTQTECEDSEGNTYPETIHAEVMAVKNFEKSYGSGPLRTSYTMYVTHKPCSNCYVFATNKGFRIAYKSLSPRLDTKPDSNKTKTQS